MKKLTILFLVIILLTATACSNASPSATIPIYLQSFTPSVSVSPSPTLTPEPSLEPEVTPDAAYSSVSAEERVILAPIVENVLSERNTLELKHPAISLKAIKAGWSKTIPDLTEKVSCFENHMSTYKWDLLNLSDTLYGPVMVDKKDIFPESDDNSVYIMMFINSTKHDLDIKAVRAILLDEEGCLTVTLDADKRKSGIDVVFPNLTIVEINKSVFDSEVKSVKIKFRDIV